MIKTIYLAFLLVSLVISTAFLGCNQSQKDSPTNTTADTLPYKRVYDEQGRLKSECPILNGKRHGLARNFYPNGTVHSEITYVNNIKNGPSTWYFENGQPFRITPFVNGLKHGMQIKYYKSGKVMAQMPFENDQLVVGTKEFDEHDRIISGYPEVLVSKINRIANSGKILFIIDKPKVKDIEECYAEFVLNGVPQKVMGVMSDGKMVCSVSASSLKNIKTIKVVVNFKTKIGNNILLQNEIAL